MFVQSIVDLVFPPVCCICERGPGAICRNCRRGIGDVAPVRDGPLVVAAAGDYAGDLRRAILAFKRGRRDVGVALADLIADRCADAADAGALLVPVPTAPSRRDLRGFDQGRLLARELERHWDLPSLAALERRGGDSQHGRSRAKRLAATNRYAVARGRARLLAGTRVVLVDDVVTTGATLRDCTRALAAAGALVLRAVAVARAPAAAAPGLYARAAPHTSRRRIEQE